MIASRACNILRIASNQVHNTCCMSHSRNTFDSVKEYLGFISTNLKGTLLESMAKRMNEKDIMTFMKHFDRPDVQISMNPAEKATVIVASPVIAIPKPSYESPTVDPMKDQIYANKILLDPVLGELVCDLGYKKTYKTSARNLMTCEIWEKQRILRPERAKEMAKAKIKNKSHTILPGIISLFRDATTHKCGIIDGQHRSAAILYLSQQGYWNELERNILIDVFQTNSDADIKSLFVEINSAEPVRLVDLQAITEQPDKEYVHEHEHLAVACDLLVQKYPEMFKTSARCRAPHLNIDVTRDELFQSQLYRRLEFKSAEALLACIEAINKRIKGKLLDELKEYDLADSVHRAAYQSKLNHKLRGKSFEQAAKKAQLYGFYLGLIDSKWMYES